MRNGEAGDAKQFPFERSPQLQNVEAGGATYIPGLPVTLGTAGAALGTAGTALGTAGATGTALGTDGTGAAGAGTPGAGWSTGAWGVT